MLKHIQQYDLNVFRYIYIYANRLSLSKFALIVSATADGWLYLSLIPLSLLQSSDQQSAFLFTACTGFAMERIIYLFIKNILKRRRPYHAIEGFSSIIYAADEFSLPSGHTSAAFFFVTFLCFGYSILFLPLYLWALCVGGSRIILGVHFPADTLVGAFLGTTIALAVL